MKVGITGTRKFTDQNHINKIMNEIYSSLFDPSRIDGYNKVEYFVIGGAIGVDKLVEHWCNQKDLPAKIYLPDYNKHGRKAPLIRNQQIVDDSDMLIAFPLVPRGSSHGTEFTINCAVKKGIPIIIKPVNQDIDIVEEYSEN